MSWLFFPNISIKSCGLYVFLFRRCKKGQVTCGQSLFPSRRRHREHVRPVTKRAKLIVKGQAVIKHFGSARASRPNRWVAVLSCVKLLCHISQ